MEEEESAVVFNAAYWESHHGGYHIMEDWEAAPPGTNPKIRAKEVERRSSRRGRTGSLLALVANRTSPKDAANRKLLEAVDKGEIRKVKGMLLRAKHDLPDLDVNYRGHGGVTALHLAGEPELALLLLRNGANSQAATDAKESSGEGYAQGGNTPLHAAARGGNVEIVHVLLEYSAQRSSSNKGGDRGGGGGGGDDAMALVGIVNDAGQTALDVARVYMHQRVVKFLENPRLAVARAKRQRDDAAAAAEVARAREEADTTKHRKRREQKQRREREESILAEEEEAAAAAEELQEKSRALLTRNEAKKLAPMAHYPE